MIKTITRDGANRIDPPDQTSIKCLNEKSSQRRFTSIIGVPISTRMRSARIIDRELTAIHADTDFASRCKQVTQSCNREVCDGSSDSAPSHFVYVRLRVRDIDQGADIHAASRFHNGVISTVNKRFQHIQKDQDATLGHRGFCTYSAAMVSGHV